MTIDLAQSPFWLVVAAAVVVLTPLTHGGGRRWALALLNASLLFLLLRTWALVILAGALAALVLARIVGRRQGLVGTALLALGSIALLALFIIHKRPELASAAHAGWLSPLLVAVGFSYVSLRVIELWRAAFEERLEKIGLAGAVNYLLPFHMLAAGPIQSYDDFVAQPAVPDRLSFDQVLDAVGRIVWGLFKKYVLAHCVMQLGSTSWHASGPYHFLELHLQYLYLYLDFSAYSDIAVGVGTLIGVLTPENFNHPYLARNITEFWERWHISLSMWLRRNLFMPMQLAMARRDVGPLTSAVIAIGITFLICGAWHALTVGFLFWGLYQAAGLIVCHFYGTMLRKYLGGPGFKRYHANLPIRIVSTIITIEFFTYSLLLVGMPWRSTW
ncbi:MAG TPA: MBOAT family O-acyltransferase [Pirellulales bacterium]|nr:MBOAT family O-acyltransferase [Pirellulales bacterium]